MPTIIPTMPAVMPTECYHNDSIIVGITVGIVGMHSIIIAGIIVRIIMLMMVGKIIMHNEKTIVGTSYTFIGQAYKTVGKSYRVIGNRTKSKVNHHRSHHHHRRRRRHRHRGRRRQSTCKNAL